MFTSKRRTLAVALICLVVAGFASLIAFNSSGRKGTGASPANQLVGTWATEDGKHFQFRSDGTARSRNAGKKNSPIRYFEWESDGQTVKFIYLSQGTVKRFFGKLTSVPEYEFQIRDLDQSGLTLVDSPDSIERLTAVKDTLLDAAP
ncbi:hypothetical protein FYK55_23595 [Roseiconus nitratireducens]|uniref:Lipocalin-like domain-containing protein n=1 Tax=Roseiconus nitratireducens TaxID=2605748 RepID=A0A5M6CZU9_9BACT|nr:hypothetical protein [Roseiconus nitratireducens]KAA5539562.1 hypothetical protein FYK55_23595 [Roseiconus nitratireducens]